MSFLLYRGDQSIFGHSHSHHNCLCSHTNNPKTKGARGKLKGNYRRCRDSNAKLNLKIKFKDWQPDGVKIKEGDLLDWSINTAWEANKKSGWDDQCDEENTGSHYDSTIACGPLSEYLIIPNTNSATIICTNTETGPHAHSHNPHCVKDGSNVKPAWYDCDQQDAGNTCEYGDLSGKLGQLEVQKDGDGKLFVKFKGVDKYFLQKSDFETPNTDYSIVITKDEVRILCAKLMFLCNKS